jgi:dihydrodipicolinate reductase (EC 1.3.1.26)
MSMKAPLKIVIAGSAGRMGQVLLEAISQSPDCELHGALERAGSAYRGAARFCYRWYERCAGQ